MARHKEFDPDLALERAMHLFWRRGYEATSVQDLLDELGVARQSLYATFGSKDELYARALDRYCAHHSGALVDALEGAQEIRPVLRTLLHDMAAADTSGPDRRGCLLVNAATERAGGDPATAQRVNQTLCRVEAALELALLRARARGELRADTDPVGLARFLTTFIQGLRVMGKGGAGRAVLDDAISTALSLLD